MSGQKVDRFVENKSKNLDDPGARMQTLNMIHVISGEEVRYSSVFLWLQWATLRRWKAHSAKYKFVSIIGWLLLTLMLTVSSFSGLLIAAAYLVLMPVTGLCLHIIIRKCSGLATI